MRPRDAPQLEMLRIALGLALLASFVPLTPHLHDLYGDEGWISREAFAALSLEAGWYSVFAWWHGRAALTLLHAAFIVMALAFTAGVGVRWVKWPIWLLYLSYLNRNPAIVYGVDLLMASLLLPLCLAPTGGLTGSGSRPLSPSSAWRASMCLALVRWQMAVLFFFTAAHKLRGELWWSGEAVWVVLNNYEFAHTSVAGWIAGHAWLVTLATHGALLLEIAYPFLIWPARTRFWILGTAIAFHVATAAFFGLYLFAWVAIAGHLAFAPDGLIELTRHRAARVARAPRLPAVNRSWSGRLAARLRRVRSARPSPSARASCATHRPSSGRRTWHSNA